MILDLFKDYIPFIVILITLTLNVLLIIFKSQWYVYLIANVILIIILGFIGETPFDIIGEVVEVIGDILVGIIKRIFSVLSGCSSR